MPVTSPDVEYTVVDAFSVAVVRYNAPLNVSAALDARVGAVPKLCVAVRSSPMNDVHMLCVLAMIVPFLGYAHFTCGLIGGPYCRYE